MIPVLLCLGPRVVAVRYHDHPHDARQEGAMWLAGARLAWECQHPGARYPRVLYPTLDGLPEGLPDELARAVAAALEDDA